MAMNNDFWGLVDQCRRVSHDDLLAFVAAWERQLSTMDKEAVETAFSQLTTAMAGLADWQIFGSAWLFSGGSRDDFMPRFCEWVISNGEDFYHEVQKNPDRIPCLKTMQGRWCEAKLGGLTHHVLVSKFGVVVSQRPDQLLWAPIVAGLGIDVPLNASNTLICLTLKKHSPIQPDDWTARFPHLHGWCDKRKVKPAHDRRTPMTFEKFWLLVNDAKSCHDASAFLTYSLECLPTSQIVDFDSILDDLLVKAGATIEHLKSIDPNLADLTDEEIGSLFIVMGKEVYDAILGDPQNWNAVAEASMHWKGQRLRHAAHQAFLHKTGHCDALVA